MLCNYRHVFSPIHWPIWSLHGTIRHTNADSSEASRISRRGWKPTRTPLSHGSLARGPIRHSTLLAFIVVCFFLPHLAWCNFLPSSPSHVYICSTCFLFMVHFPPPSHLCCAALTTVLYLVHINFTVRVFMRKVCTRWCICVSYVCA